MISRVSRYALPLLLAAGALLHPERAAACECLDHTVAKAKKISKAVFVGTVEEVNGDGLVRLSVERLWKGDNVPEFVVDPRQGLCSAWLEMGKTYLVYAYWDEDRRVLSTDVCIRTRPVGETDDMKQLGRPKVIRSVRKVKQ
jgi:hypothetical protein